MVATALRPIRTLAALLSLALLGGPAVFAADGPTGSIRGSVLEADFLAPLGGVRVTLVEAMQTVETTSEGTFVFDRIPPGRYTVTFAKAGYDRAVRPGVVVTASRLTDLQVELSPEVYEMPELIVTGTDLLADSEIGILEIRADASLVQDAISSELISKAGASDVAGALKLVVGASVVEGKYATVRGLSDRYTGTTVNGIRVPSTDPRKRAVQIDVFPTGTVENITVTKTFSPDLQGDFTGGGVDIQTKRVPDTRIFSISLSTQHNSLATGNPDFLSYEGGGVSTWGFAGSERDLPAEASPQELENLPPRPNATPRPTEEDIANAQIWDRYANSFAPVMGVSTREPGMDYGFSVVAGNRYTIGRNDALGFIGALTYKHEYEVYEHGQNNRGTVTVAGADLTEDGRDDTRGVDELLIGALGSAVWQPNDNHELSLTLIANQGANDEARIQLRNRGYVERNQTLHYTERTVGSLQLRGDHDFPDLLGGALSDLQLDWVVARNLTKQDEPDRRLFRAFYDPDLGTEEPPNNSTEPQNTRRYFRKIKEDGTVLSADVTLPFRQWSASEGKLKAGFYSERIDRSFDELSFYYSWTTRQCCGSSTAEVRENRSKSRYEEASDTQYWTDVFADPDRIGLAPNVDAPNVADNQMLWVPLPLNLDVNYSGDQSIDAFYAMAELPLTRRLRLIGGARLEQTKINVVPTRPDGLIETIGVSPTNLQRFIEVVPQEEAIARVDESDVLPAISAVYEIVPNMNLRASWTKTIARPTIRELAPAATSEFLDGDEVVGNPELVLSDITNRDLRWEWFRRPGEVLAASWFTKDLTNPIEYLSFGASNRYFIQPVNYERGEVKGFELEARTSLDVIHRSLSGITVGANYTSIDSKVFVPQTEQDALATWGLDTPSRRLQGQPEFVFNANITYDNDKTGTSAGVFYNRIGETLLTGAAVGDSAVPDSIDDEHGTLTARVKQRIQRVGDSEIAVSLKASNIQQTPRSSYYDTPYGATYVRTYRDQALKVGLSISWKW